MFSAVCRWRHLLTLRTTFGTLRGRRLRRWDRWARWCAGYRGASGEPFAHPPPSPPRARGDSGWQVGGTVEAVTMGAGSKSRWWPSSATRPAGEKVRERLECQGVLAPEAERTMRIRILRWWTLRTNPLVAWHEHNSTLLICLPLLLLSSTPVLQSFDSNVLVN